MRGDAVLWAIITVASAGLLLGLRFRLNALVAASVALTALSWLAATLMQLSFLTTLGLTYFLLAALQGGYLAGVAATCAWTRIRTGSEQPTPNGQIRLRAKPATSESRPPVGSTLPRL
jgi:hypothetical protein